MKALAFILCGLLCLATVRLLDPAPAPMLIDAAMLVQAGGEFCDVPTHRKPVIEGPRHKLDYRMGHQYGDKGIA